MFKIYVHYNHSNVYIENLKVPDLIKSPILLSVYFIRYAFSYNEPENRTDWPGAID